MIECRDYDTNFSEESFGWVSENRLPFNKFMGRGPTFNATSFMRFGKVSITMRTSKIPGSITAFILISDTGDEIDFEMIGGDSHQIQTNYFYSGEALYTVNGGFHTIKGNSLYDEMHTFTIDWQPDKIVWAVDGQTIREKLKSETCKDGKCKFPNSPSRVQIGLWDGSFESGTAYWSRGPINWADQIETINSLIGRVTIECNPQTNKVV
ncbi:glycoside hydrolase [Hesseltinella vesiculosa]|uniref:Glycoside hydrolase n=1 Tax=Hesseltinella vesiculosa TaxID=101127 RepID=A0A1X2GR99_9FUNG|nr:glycoside hydrolase [Hesseltinella vesiculosa]